jgi:hypothetical protein
MSLSPGFKWLIILTVPLTLGFKAVMGEPDSYESKAAINEFLSRHRFNIQEQTVAGILTVVATSGACRMIVAEGSPNGWTRDMTRQILGVTNPQFVVFRGTIYTEQPTWRTFTDHWLSKNIRRLGLARHASPIIAVSANESCDAERLPWDELSSPEATGRTDSSAEPMTIT